METIKSRVNLKVKIKIKNDEISNFHVKIKNLK